MRVIYTSIFLLLTGAIFAQPDAGYQIDNARTFFHYKLDDAQKKLLKQDGIADDNLNVTGDEELNLQLTYTATSRIDAIQKNIELDTKLDNNQKITYLRGLTEFLGAFTDAVNRHQLKWIHFPGIIKTYEEAVALNNKTLSITPALPDETYEGAMLIAKNLSFFQNPNMAQTREWLVLKYIQEHPSQLIEKLMEHLNMPSADSLLNVAAKRYPERIYTYAQAPGTPLGRKVAQSTDPTVQLIRKLSRDNSGQLYMPFLDQISKGQVSIDSLKKITGDEFKYFRLLVNTQIANTARMQQGDTPTVQRALTDRLRARALESFVREINALHDSPDAIRFKKIQSLSAEELYYLPVLCESEIYTSSYKYVYYRMYEVMPVKSTDSLLAKVHSDRYKKFITMAANYNTLDHFISKLDKAKATRLMTDFVNNLDRGTDVEDIEDAVDVANAYASINHADIKELMLSQVTKNLEAANGRSNKRAQTIYRIEKLIMESEDSTKSINLTDSLGVLPVYDVRNNYLKDSLGRIVMQMYFYGDEAGRGSFAAFRNAYSNKLWKKFETPDFVQFTSIGTTVPYIMFANNAKTEDNDEDEKATERLIQWMGQNGYQPSVSIHRGHSYFLKETIEKLLPSSKIVVLGSCGAYHNLHDILQICPGAYIIGSKQTGYGEINNRLVDYMADLFKKGGDINWPKMQADVAKLISKEKQEGYDDYMFPHKNLGAIFINAYKIAMEKDDLAGR